MPDVRVFGGLSGSRKHKRSDVLLAPAVPSRAIGRPTVRLHDLTRRMVSDLPARYLDLLEIASYVYSADQFTRRDLSTMPRMGAEWRRSFAFQVAVRDVPFWNRPEVATLLADTLGFLSDDRYAFDFVQHRPGKPAQAFLEFGAQGPVSGFVPDEVMLFSGGLDSFAGAVDALLRGGKRVALVSHTASPMVAHYQTELVAALRRRAGSDRLLHISVGITKGGGRRAVEFTQRSRSFLFAVLGFLVAHLFDRTSISFYENGVVSLNLPLASHVVGGRATRTTHPRVLHGLAGLFSQAANRTVQVGNPFFWKTKSEVVRVIADNGCSDLVPMTFSCAATRQATKLGGRHCGVCSQCLDRRFGILAAGCGGFEPAANYDVELFRGERKAGTHTIMAESYVLSGFQHASSSEAAFVGTYGIEVLRAARYMPDLSLAEAVRRLHLLHKRHGAAVVDVVNRAASDVGTIADRLTLPDSSLIAMLTGSQAQDITCLDPTERESSAEAQVRDRPSVALTRPIVFSISRTEDLVVFAGAVRITGRGAQLIRTLLPHFHSAPQRDLSPDQGYMKTGLLADALQANEEGVRQIAGRLRDELEADFREQFGVDLAEDDVLQSRKWKGCRLSPHLAFTPAPVESEQPSQAAE